MTLTDDARTFTGHRSQCQRMALKKGTTTMDEYEALVSELTEIAPRMGKKAIAYLVQLMWDAKLHDYRETRERIIDATVIPVVDFLYGSDKINVAQAQRIADLINTRILP